MLTAYIRTLRRSTTVLVSLTRLCSDVDLPKKPMLAAILVTTGLRAGGGDLVSNVEHDSVGLVC